MTAQVLKKRSRSPLAEALLRLRKNHMAMVGLAIVTVMMILGFSAPLLARYGIGFSPEEQHTSFAFAPPGSADVSFDFPRYDGDKTAFAQVDLDGDGAIRCTLERVPHLTDANAPALLKAALGRNLAWPQGSRVPLAEVMAAWAGQVRCPELETLRDAERFYTFLLDRSDRAVGHAMPTNLRRPDRLLSREEFPNDSKDLADPKTVAAAATLGLLGDHGWALLTHDRGALLDRDALNDATRRTRFDPDDLLRRFDANHDLRIDRSEFPGLPAVRRFWLGTDQKGRDLLVRLLYGARVSLTIGLLATLVSFVIGVTYGAIAGYAGGRLDGLMMRVVDVLYGLPFMFIVILLLVIAGRSTLNLFVALGAVSWLNMARIVRGQVLSIRRREFVEAATAMGLSEARILLRHVLPNTVGPVVVYATLSVPAVILEEAFLSFLGLGVQPPDASWGSLLSEGARLLQDRPWLLIWPAAALALTLFSLNFLGDGLRDALDPRSSR
jgi:oligopeptide transport system permease protein